MSISGGSVKQKNPAGKFLEWNGDKGVFYYYDKEKKEKVDMPSKFQVIGLDELSTIKGWDERASSGIYSNEVRDLVSDELTVKNFNNDLIRQGVYGEIRDAIKSSGGKFCKSVYATLVSKGNSVELVNLSLRGSALSAWIDAGIDVSKGLVITCGTNPEEKKKGKTTYYEPMFTTKLLPEGEVRDTVVQLDRDVLQPYLAQYFKGTAPVAANKEKPSEAFLAAASTDDESDQDLPF